MDTQTIVNGKEFVEYDKFDQFLNELDERIATQEEYSGYPNAPENYFDAYKIYENASEEEKKYMFSILYSKFVSALQQWKSESDKLWTENGRKEHNVFIERYKELLPYMGKSKSMFSSLV